MGIIANRCDWEINQCIDGQYYVVQVLGEGAFGKVYKVRDITGGMYALKLLKLWEIVPELREPLMNRFEMEYKTGLIRSDYLVHSISYGIIEGNPFIVMEYCPNGNLLQYMKTHSVDFVKIAKEVLYGLNDLHQNGKVHRDLKPENVLIRANGNSALTDFGISGDRNHRMTERNILGRPQQLFGTYAYMPPEQVNRLRGNATVLPTTDIFSFGVMMYQLLTGKLPFGELNDHNDLVIYQRNAKAGNWNQQCLDNSIGGPDWKILISNCLLPDFRKRSQSVQDVLMLLPLSANIDHLSQGMAKVVAKSGKVSKLKIMQGEEFGRIYHLDKLLSAKCRILTMGRGEENDICLQERDGLYVSRKHCTLEVNNSYTSWFIRDGQWIVQKRKWIDSLNGTYVNSIPVTRAGRKLCINDIITIGNITLKIES